MIDCACPHQDAGEAHHDSRCPAHRARLLTRVEQLETRQQELLQQIWNLSQSTPLPAEYEGWTSQRAALVAEVGTLKARVAELEREVSHHETVTAWAGG